MSEAPSSPQGVSITVEYPREVQMGAHLGKRIPFTKLPRAIKQHVHSTRSFFRREGVLRNNPARKARVLFPDGRVIEFDSNKLAYEFWIGLPKGQRAALRKIGDDSPVLSHEYVSNPADWHSFPWELIRVIEPRVGQSDWDAWIRTPNDVILRLYNMATHDRVYESSRIFRRKINAYASRRNVTIQGAWRRFTATDVGEVLNQARREAFTKNPGRYSRTRIASPREFDPRSFRTIDPGRRGHHKLVVACPKGQWDARRGRCKVGMETQAVLKEKGNSRGNVLNNQRRKEKVRANPGDREAMMAIKGVKPWMLEDKQFVKAVKKFKEFHGCYPESVKPNKKVKMPGSGFLVSMGKAPGVSYDTKGKIKGSNKRGSAWLHEFNKRGQPDIMCTPDGKTIVTAGGTFAVKDWVRR